ncbi:MAG: hypothetical protein PHU80_03090 [Kiritimatiellae bacterium]|nr:hypothetical protein [Kiritimatiellia bacterium]
MLDARMMTLIVCIALGIAHAQSLDIGQGRGGVSGRNAVVLSPQPPAMAGELRMAVLPVFTRPPAFYLNFGTSGRHGPFELADNALVGNEHSPYRLRLSEGGQQFELLPEHDAGAAYGPFATTNGAVVKIGQTVMTMVRIPARLEVSLRHAAKINQMPMVGIAPYDQKLATELQALRTKFAALSARVDAETADIALQGVPRIRSRAVGGNFSPVVQVSKRDKQNAGKGAELSAVNFMETLFRQHFRIRSQAITEGHVYHFGMPPGDYVLCAMQKVKDAQAPGMAGSATAVWWTTFTFDGERPMAMTLAEENAVTWREVFVLSR